MTVIAAMKFDRGVVMGGDSAGVDGYRLTRRQDPKVFRVGELLIGYTSSFRMAQLLRYGWKDCLPIADLVPPADEGRGFEFMVSDFIPRARWLWKQGGYLGSNYEGRDDGGCFLVAWDAQLYQVADDLQVGISRERFDAVGCGCDLALGAMAAMPLSPGTKDDAWKYVRTALSVAEQFSAGVRGTMSLMSCEVRADG